MHYQEQQQQQFRDKEPDPGQGQSDATEALIREVEAAKARRDEMQRIQANSNRGGQGSE